MEKKAKMETRIKIQRGGQGLKFIIAVENLPIGNKIKCSTIK